jgi:hypothetical protein
MANGQTGGKNSSSPFVLTAFISFGLLIFSSIGWDTMQYTLQFPAARLQPKRERPGH